MTIRHDPDSAAQLTAICQGAVLLPGDEKYAETCAGWNLAWTQRPAVVVRAASESDVTHAVRYATAQGLAVAVQNTGHGVTIPADEYSVLIVTADLDDVRINPQARTATVGGGSAWAPVLAAAQRHGLAPLLGSAPHVGAVGYSLGGGFGWLARKHGLAVDSVRSLRVVLADGRVVTASATEEPELFWALCGTAGSALGVVVEMTITLAPVSVVYAGNLFYPISAARDVFDRYLDWASQAPTELTSAFNITSFPPLEAVPELLRGKTFVIVRGCYADSPGANEEVGIELVDQLRTWREPLMDTWATIPFARSGEISMDPVDPVPAASSGRWLSKLDHTVLEVMFDAITDDTAPMLFVEARHAGGAIRRDNPAVSFAARGGEWLLEFVGMITGPGADAELDRRFETAWRRIATNLSDLPGYLNFAEGHEQVQISRQAFDGETLARLATVKRHYDPDDLFRHGIPLMGSE